MKMSLYALVVSGLYALLAVKAPEVAQALVIAFIAAIVVPATWEMAQGRHRRAHIRRRGQRR
jgi:hypothetical protein